MAWGRADNYKWKAKYGGMEAADKSENTIAKRLKTVDVASTEEIRR